ncbi:hypothetical protein QE197_04660 [Arsenophonus nasoniae]|uniref:Uncharacterized protein n=1 Tax=Arsenophonus nasoniae TaxID=638 RepID=A0A4P7KRB6_9GAMM|nr:hypothetical protein [Arsenophonus nasoniae]QBY42597.1 hypothetical protein ArsFIN_11540 [Arsenophonus nasoniae]WGM00055.1 hypothetical protein QE210_09065 [Arsenophonus nasoniae]WGM06693.1 hypothetical protein QE258_05110 [Arsenophonus nasoniae]WGM11637.1 hypothetical protein QE197_04660 [Arsenophonus nasoniae]WGM16327.1 hypothetical protein QE193_04615 [Arsenophonus nasoniae]
MLETCTKASGLIPITGILFTHTRPYLKYGHKKTAELTGAVAVRKVFLAPKRTIAHDFFFRQWLLLGYTYLNTGGFLYGPICI